MSISKINNPDFAEKLMSTFYCGSIMSSEEEIECQKIWNENNNVRFEVLKRVVEICGDIDTPQARYIKAIAWSFNSVIYSNERIKAINHYLNNKLYKQAYINMVCTIDKGLKYGEKVHIMTMLQYMADAYCHLKMYDKEEETYKKIYDLKVIIPNSCIGLAKFYSKRGQRDKAIELLRKEKKTLTYFLNKEYRQPIDQYLKELEKKSVGINKHVFQGYDTSPGIYYGTWDKPIFNTELENKARELRNKYKNLFNNHREFLERIDLCETNIKNNVEIEKYKELYNNYCLSDINIYPQIMNYYKEFNSLGSTNKIEYADNRSTDYPVFRKLISFYEKEKRYREAIKLCDIAISYGINKYFGKISMNEKKEKLENEMNKV